MKLPEMPSYPYIGQDWDDTARLLLGDWGKACYVAGEKQERALWELTKAGEALGEPAATPVVPPGGRKSIAKLLDLVADYWNLAHAEGREQRTQDTEDGAASAKWNEIRTEALTLAASPSPRTPEQPEQPEQQVSYTNLMSDSVTVNPVECSGTRPAAADDGRDTRAAIQRGPINPRTNRPWSLADPEVQPLLEAHKEEMRDPVKARAFLTQTGILGPTGRLAKRFGGDD